MGRSNPISVVKPESTEIMEHRGFFERAGPFTLARVAEVAGAELAAGAQRDRIVSDVRPLAEAGPTHVSFLDNRKYLSQLQATKACAVFVLPAFQDRLPAEVCGLLTKQPYHGFARALALFYPQFAHPLVAQEGSPAIDRTARLEDGVVLEPNVVVGPGAMIGRGTRVAAGAVIGANVSIGRNGYVGALATVSHALVGDRVTIHTGARIGQDGFGFAMGRTGHLKVPQIGRVVIQDDVEIGANTTIDRGALKDTIIGEGTKIDNLVQIGHNVIIGRHCVIVAQTGIAGSTELGDFVVMGGQSGTVGHIKIGSGAQIAGAAHPKDDVPPGARMGGTPARPLKDWARELAVLKRLAEQHKGGRDSDEAPEDG